MGSERSTQVQMERQVSQIYLGLEFLQAYRSFYVDK